MTTRNQALGLDLKGTPLEDDEFVQSVVVVAEVLGSDGVMRLGLMSSDPCTAWQMLGMLRAGVLASELDLREAWEGD